MYFDIYQEPGIESWHWRLSSESGDSLAHGGQYPTRSECERAVIRMKQTTMSTEVRYVT